MSVPSINDTTDLIPLSISTKPNTTVPEEILYTNFKVTKDVRVRFSGGALFKSS